MKKILPLLIILVFISCFEQTLISPTIPIIPKNVEIIISSNNPISDEIIVSYRDFDKNEDIFGLRQFTYDNNGQQEPIVISFPEYTHSKISGNAYRKNGSPYNLNAKIYIDDVLELEVESIGSTKNFAAIVFDHTIKIR